MFKVVCKIRCPVCSELVKLNDKVTLDIINTVMHQSCYYKSPQPRLPLKDEGTFKKMIFKYPFFSVRV
jgi:hypothetical protein